MNKKKYVHIDINISMCFNIYNIYNMLYIYIYIYILK